MIRQKSEKKCILKDFGTFRAYFWYNIHAMKSEKFDFGAMLDEQLKGIKRSYKFGNSFNESKSLTGPKKAALAVESGDNAEIKAAYESGDAIAGLVEKEIKGGFEVTVAGARAFCPASQIDKFRKEPAEYTGRKFDFIVTEYSKDDFGLNVVVSRRALLEVQSEALKEAMLEQLTEGETLNGTVTRVMEFGVFVDLGGIEGLIPAREVAWERVADFNTILKSGDGVTVKVLHINKEEGKISLSRKECLIRTFKKSAEDLAAEQNEAEVARWMTENKKKNANVGSMASLFSSIKVDRK